jgi:hypothetical protein
MRGAIIKGHRANAAVVCGSALLTVYLGFEAGGAFPGSTAVAAVGVAVVVALRVAMARDPLAAFGRRSLVAVASLAAFAAWTLASADWSHAPGRAVLEFNRVLLYLLVLALFASLPRAHGRLSALAVGFGLGSVVLCCAALATRTLPAVFPIRTEPVNDRLAYPLTYWNALGLMAVLGILVCIGLSSQERLPRMVRALTAGAVPLLGATLLLTFSRGAIAAGVVGLLALCGICRSRSLLFCLAAVVPTTSAAIGAAYAAHALASVNPTGPAAVTEGHRVIAVVAIACAAALLLRALLSHWECGRTRTPRARHRRLVLAAAAALLVVAGGGAVALHLPHAVEVQYHHFVDGDQLPAGQPLRARLTSPANNGRLSQWRVAVHAWESEIFHGTGAGTYQNEWNQQRDQVFDVVNAHSLYLEVLSDLGVVGLGLLLVCLVVLLSGLGGRLSGLERPVAASLLAATLAWLLQAGVDWDWQMPVVTWWLFAAGGLALARADDIRRRGPGRLGRLVLLLVLGLLAVLPAQVARSQRDLDSAVSAFRRGNCAAAASSALASIAALGARADAYEVLGYCDVRYGEPTLAVAAIQSAINRDPGNWEYEYDMAVVRGVSGLDPRPAIRQALVLNPLSPVVIALARGLETSDMSLWRARAAKTPLLIS